MYIQLYNERVVDCNRPCLFYNYTRRQVIFVFRMHDEKTQSLDSKNQKL